MSYVSCLMSVRLMNTVVVGAQWGDEGKGVPQADARFVKGVTCKVERKMPNEVIGYVARFTLHVTRG